MKKHLYESRAARIITVAAMAAGALALDACASAAKPRPAPTGHVYVAPDCLPGRAPSAEDAGLAVPETLTVQRGKHLLNGHAPPALSTDTAQRVFRSLVDVTIGGKGYLGVAFNDGHGNQDVLVPASALQGLSGLTGTLKGTDGTASITAACAQIEDVNGKLPNSTVAGHDNKTSPVVGVGVLRASKPVTSTPATLATGATGGRGHWTDLITKNRKATPVGVAVAGARMFSYAPGAFALAAQEGGVLVDPATGDVTSLFITTLDQPVDTLVNDLGLTLGKGSATGLALGSGTPVEALAAMLKDGRLN
ncbi:MAG TPA: hypothetical protein VLH84_05185 [Patescibacteria group bacterium]|nr:hypothetical protein [Patescibacteria group bacterium]